MDNELDLFFLKAMLEVEISGGISCSAKTSTTRGEQNRNISETMNAMCDLYGRVKCGPFKFMPRKKYIEATSK